MRGYILILGVPIEKMSIIDGEAARSVLALCILEKIFLNKSALL